MRASRIVRRSWSWAFALLGLIAPVFPGCDGDSPNASSSSLTSKPLKSALTEHQVSAATRVLPELPESLYESALAISTLAGGGAGDEGLARDAYIAPRREGLSAGTQAFSISPGEFALCGDGCGTIFLADVANYRVRAIHGNGSIETIAGTGRLGSSRQQGPARLTSLLRPESIAGDPLGNVIFGEVNAIKYLNLGESEVSFGTVTIAPGSVADIAGTGEFFVDPQARLQSGPALDIPIADPTSLACDAAGNVYFSMGENVPVIRRIARDTGVVETIAGTGIRVPAGELAFDGPAASTSFSHISSIALHPDGILFIADVGRAVWAMNLNSYSVTLFPGNPLREVAIAPQYLSVLLIPSGNHHLALSGESLFLLRSASEGSDSLLMRLDASGNLDYLSDPLRAQGPPSGDHGPLISATLGYAEGVAADSLGNVVFITGPQRDKPDRIRGINLGSEPVYIGGAPIEPGSIAHITGNPDYSGDGQPGILARLVRPDC